MIYPTRTAVIAAAAGAPVALIVAAVAPALWYLALAWPMTVVALCLADGLRIAGTATGKVELPDHGYVGETSACTIRLALGNRARLAEVALQVSPQVRIEESGDTQVSLQDGRGAVLIPLDLVRRGIARFDRLWIRSPGPFGLVWHQTELALESSFPILPDIRPLHQRGAAIFQRFAMEGSIAQVTQGNGLDFDELVEFRPGMDRRSIDWKQSARHQKLHAKRWRTERNNQIVFAVDSGRQMCEPVAGLPRVDRSVSAMLLTAWIALKLGDRVGIHAFDSRPRLASGFVSGGGAFGQLERVAAQIDYSGEETNFTFALSNLAARLKRRSMIIMFTELTDMVSAEFLLAALRRLVETHLVLVVILRDEELEEVVGRAPQTPDDVTRAITAAALLKERRVVITGLQHLGVHVVESEYDQVGERLVQGYLELKRRNLL